MPIIADLAQMRRSDSLGLLQEFVRAAAAAEDTRGLKALVGDLCTELGIDYFALLHHVRFGRPIENQVRLTNYPISWIATLRQQDRASDPVLRTAERTSSGFCWRDIETLVRLSEKERALFRQAERHGIGEGFTVPNHIPGEAFGSSSFAVLRGKEFTPEQACAAQALGPFAFEAARRLNETQSGAGEAYVEPAPLTERQRECLIYAARGKSDTVIAQLLDIRPRTVNEHIEAAKRRYCVATRSQLLVRALFRSEITYPEVLD